jgi:uncharacterized protein (DUF1697 family)
MSRYLALLRGVNVGGRNVVAMAELRALFASLGHAEVTTFIQSGNVLFDAPELPAAAALEAAIDSRFGISVVVAVRTPAELDAAIANNPFTDADPARLHIGFLTASPVATALDRIERDAFLPDRFALLGEHVYLELPNGMGRARLPAAIDRALGGAVTVRNWKTTLRLAELARA